MKTIYQTFVNLDFTEGRGPMIASIAFSWEKDAQDYCKRQEGIQGFMGSGWEVRELTVFDDLREALSIKDREILDKALQKLSTEERRVLGV